MGIENSTERKKGLAQLSKQHFEYSSLFSPNFGHIYHHIAVLSQDNILQQLFFYGKALSVSQPDFKAFKAVSNLFKSSLGGAQVLSPITLAYVKTHAILFSRKNSDRFDSCLAEFISCLDKCTSDSGQQFLRQGCYIGILNCISLLSRPTTCENTHCLAKAPRFKEAVELFSQTFNTICLHLEDKDILNDVLGFLYITLVFLGYMSKYDDVMEPLKSKISWGLLVSMLESLSQELSLLPQDNLKVGPEELAMRGLSWADDFLLDLFGKGRQPCEPYVNPASINDRKRRIFLAAKKVPSLRLQLRICSTEYGGEESC
jgi:hypothetical protein